MFTEMYNTDVQKARDPCIHRNIIYRRLAIIYVRCSLTKSLNVLMRFEHASLKHTT